MFVKYGQQDSGVYITGTQGALHSFTVTWLKGWDRLSLALQCMSPILIRDLTIQQRNYLRTKGREPASELRWIPRNLLSSHTSCSLEHKNLVIICCSCKGKEIFVSPNKPTIFLAFLLLLLSAFCKVPNYSRVEADQLKGEKSCFKNV